MPSDTWVSPGGVTSVQVEMGGSGARGSSPLPQAWRGQGGGGGGYSRKKVTVVPGNSYAVSWGDGTTISGEPPTVFNGGAVQANQGVGTNGGAVAGGMDVSYAGGNAVPSDFAGAPGSGGGGGAGRAGAGGNGTIPGGGTGGTNAPSIPVGTGGGGGTAPAGAGSDGLNPGGGGGGMGGGGGIGPDTSGVGAPGWILIYDDTTNRGFSPYFLPLASFGNPPAAPPAVRIRRGGVM